MKLQVFVVKDRASDQYGNPMFLISSGQAIRSFTDEVNSAREDNMMYKHPDDFDLFFLGVYDTNTAMFETANPEQVAIGKNVKVRES